TELEADVAVGRTLGQVDGVAVAPGLDDDVIAVGTGRAAVGQDGAVEVVVVPGGDVDGAAVFDVLVGREFAFGVTAVGDQGVVVFAVVEVDLHVPEAVGDRLVDDAAGEARRCADQALAARVGAVGAVE